MKIKLLILSIGAILTFITGVGVDLLNNSNEIEQSDNIVIADLVDIECKEEKLEKENDDIIVLEEKNTEKIKDIAEEVIIQPNITDTTKKNENNIQKNDTKLIKQDTEIKQENKQQEIKQEETTRETEKVEEKKKEEKIIKELTPSDLGYWCSEGGTHHIAGDGTNEHGYYSSWNDAQNAFENYTKGWPSVQYKISQCLCGKFYFWAIQ